MTKEVCPGIEPRTYSMQICSSTELSDYIGKPDQNAFKTLYNEKRKRHL